jgi:transcriptional regulator with XRE-family HTH domain
MKPERLGLRIRKFREMKNLTFEELVERTGLAPEFLRSVEEQDVYPSLGPLLKISRALGLRLGTFLDDGASADPVVMRLADRHEDYTAHAASKTPATMRYFSLGRGKADRHMEPFAMELLPAPAGDRKLSSHEGEEFLVVQSGQVTVYYGKEAFLLNPGDSIYYDSIVPHWVGAAGDQKAEIYAVLYMPQ